MKLANAGLNFDSEDYSSDDGKLDNEMSEKCQC